MRKNFVALILATVQQRITKTLGSTNDDDVQLTAETLLETAKAYGLIEGKRGRDGGFQATDAGLAFVGEDVATFKVAEAKVALEHEKEVKEARKLANTQKKNALQEQLDKALNKAA